MKIENTHLAPACIFSSDPIDDKTAEIMRGAQEVIEAQWLAHFNPQPCFVVHLATAFRSFGTCLFNSVRLIHPDDWVEVIDQSEIILINEAMYGLCKREDAAFTGLKVFDGNGLINLFEENTLIVAGVY